MCFTYKFIHHTPVFHVFSYSPHKENIFTEKKYLYSYILVNFILSLFINAHLHTLSPFINS